VQFELSKSGPEFRTENPSPLGRGAGNSAPKTFRPVVFETSSLLCDRAFLHAENLTPLRTKH
jgi:hypothetical protein